MVKVAWAQINPVVGDLAGNAQQIVDAAHQARAQGAQVMLAPELALTGYPPEDLLLRPAFMQACQQTLQVLAEQLEPCGDIHVVVGHPFSVPDAMGQSKSMSSAQAFNAATVFHQGATVGRYFKRELPNYQVFDEKRYFASGRDSGHGALVFKVNGLNLAVLICEDAWHDEPGMLAREAGAQVLCVLNASPFHLDKASEREARMAHRARTLGMPLIYAHLVGGQDEIVFDGASFAVDAQGRVAARAPSFEPSVDSICIEPSGQVQGNIHPLPGIEEQAWRALVLGVRDYVNKNRFPGALIGLSGGIDSALVLAIAVEALGSQRVRTVMMPSAYTAPMSWEDARAMAAGLKVRYDEISIAPMVTAFESALQDEFAGLPADATEENIQARVRGTLLMALSNKTGSIVLTTGNKSEMATGYCTLYGDMAGGFAVIKDVAKTLVYRLARWRNQQALAQHGPHAPDLIPQRIITRAPSAELRPDQTDQDSLPPYEVLDAILARYMEEDQTVEDIINAGYSRSDVEQVVRLIRTNEYKRRQAPVGIRITHRAFGRDWRYPITSRFRD